MNNMEFKVAENQFINWSVDLTLKKTPSTQNSYEPLVVARHVAASHGRPTSKSIFNKDQNEDFNRVKNFLARHGNLTSYTPGFGYLPSEYRQIMLDYQYPNPKRGYTNSEYRHPIPKNTTSGFEYFRPRNKDPTLEYEYTRPRNGCPTAELGYSRPSNGYATSEFQYSTHKNGYTNPQYGYLTPEVILLENKNENLNQALHLASTHKQSTPELVLIKEENHLQDAAGLAEDLTCTSVENSAVFQNQTLDERCITPELVLVKEECDVAFENERDSVDGTNSFEQERGYRSSDFREHQEFEYNNYEIPTALETDVGTDESEWIWCQQCSNYFHQDQVDHNCNISKSGLGKLAKPKKLKPFSCTHCVRKFARVDQLVKHLKNRLGICPYICPICGAYFSEHSALTNHDCKKLAASSEENLFKCWDCGKTFSGKNYLRKHQIRHLAVKRFKCATCGKGFAEKYHLTRHQITHSNIKELTCNECGKCFSLRQNLIVHQRIHLGIRPYKCTHCGKSFFQNVNRIAHELLHTGERPYKCVCRQEYSSRYLLNKHAKTCKKAAKFKAMEAKKSIGDKKFDDMKNKINMVESSTEKDRCGFENIKKGEVTFQNKEKVKLVTENIT